MNRILEEDYYVGEYGFFFTIKTGIDMTNLLDGEVKGVIKRPNGSIVRRNILSANLTDRPTGTVQFEIVDGDFNQEGVFTIQIFAKDADTTLARPSHSFSFNVVESVAKDVNAVFN